MNKEMLTMELLSDLLTRICKEKVNLKQFIYVLNYVNENEETFKKNKEIEEEILLKNGIKKVDNSDFSIIDYSLSFYNFLIREKQIENFIEKLTNDK